MEFAKTFGWIHSAVKVREVTGFDIDRVYDMNVIEFLNYLSYIKSYNAMETAIKTEELNKGKVKRY